MSQKKNYSRYFIILQEDDKNYGLTSEKLPSGYAKVEMKNEMCKVTFYVQNLKNTSDGYSMALICGKKEKKQILKLGKLNIDDFGRCEIASDYTMNNIGNTNIPMSEIIGAAVIKTSDNDLVPVMSGFINSSVPKWKEYNIVRAKKEETNKFDEYENSVEEKSKQLKIEKHEVENIKTEEIVNRIEDENNKEEVENCIKENQGVNENIEIPIEEEPRKCDFEIKKDNSYEFFHSIVKEYEEIKGICGEIKRCKFYKIPVTSMEKMCNPQDFNKYTVIYYPMISYYRYIKKYGYFLLGHKFNKKGELKYLVYAIPGEKNIESQPYGGMSGFVTWVSKDSSDEGEGYWMMFYDFASKTIVIPVK